MCKPRKSVWLVLTAIGIGLLISALPAVAAQAAGGRVRGTVQEASGTPVPRVQVTVRNVTTGLSRSTSCLRFARALRYNAAAGGRGTGFDRFD